MVNRRLPCRRTPRTRLRPAPIRIGLLGALLAAACLPPAAHAFDVERVSADLETLFAPPERGEPRVTPRFGDMVLADLNGDGKKEIVIPGNDSRLRVLRFSERARRPELVTWSILQTRFEGDSAIGSCYVTAKSLEKGAPETLVLAVPRGIFSVQIKGDPPQQQFFLLSDRSFFDPGRERSAPARLDFLPDVDGDQRPEIWMPQHNGMALWRKDPDTRAWQPIGTPPIPVRSDQGCGAQRVENSAFQPALYDLNFHYSLYYPGWELLDLNRDGRSELLLTTEDDMTETPTVRVECYELRSDTQFSTTPLQIRVAETGDESRVFLDCNGDGFLDLLEVQSNLDVVKPRTTIKIYISPPVRDYRFSRHTYKYITSDPLGMVLYGDWNRDGLIDLAYTQFDYKFGSTDDLVDMILGREVDVTLRLVRGRAGGYDAPDQNVRLKIRNRCFNYRLFPPISMDGDFNGDGKADLLARSQPDECQFYLSTPGRGQLGRRAARNVSIPDEAYCFIEDMDGDGRSDLVACDPKSPSITVLLSRP